ncbi:MAG: threonine/serine dehydratase [Bacillota bacterium]
MDSPQLIPNARELWSASRLISGELAPTPIAYSEYFGGLLDRDVYLKVETAQPGGSFKMRGALNRLVGPDAPDAIITSSSGNHGAALAMLGSRMGVEVTVVVPGCTPSTKIEKARALGAEVLVVGEIYDDAEAHARELASTSGRPYVSGFEDRAVVAGAATIVPEILDQIGQIGTILVPVGGGGLITGICTALEILSPKTEVIGVQPRASDPLVQSFRAGHPVDVEHGPTLSEGTAGGIPAKIVRHLIPRIGDALAVAEGEIADAIRHLLLVEKVVSEGAGALTSAALTSKSIAEPPLWPAPVVAVVSGGNIEATRLSEILSGDANFTS